MTGIKGDRWVSAAKHNPTGRSRPRTISLRARDVGFYILSQPTLQKEISPCDRLAEAIALLERASQAHPADFWIHFELGFLHGKLEPISSEASLRHITAALALRPRSSPTWNNLGRVLLALHYYPAKRCTFTPPSAGRRTPAKLCRQLRLWDNSAPIRASRMLSIQIVFIPSPRHKFSPDAPAKRSDPPEDHE